MEELFIYLGRLNPTSSEDTTTEILDKIDSKFSIPELILFLRRHETTENQKWLWELSYYAKEILEGETYTRFEEFKNYLSKHPRILSVFVNGILFILKALNDIKITHFYQTNPMEKEFVDCFQKMVTTVFHASMKLLMKNRNNLENVEVWELEYWNKNDLYSPLYKGEKIIDTGVWNEYFEFLEIETCVLKPN
jgi:hypothetical protein